MSAGTEHRGHSHGLSSAHAAGAKNSALTGAMAGLSVAVAAALILAKAAAWAASGSVALLASLADSALDLAISVVTLIAVRYAAKPPDEEHRFGHGKAEAFVGLFQAGAVALSAVLIGVEAARQLARPEPVRAEGWALASMAFSIVLTGALVAAQSWAIRRTGSVATSGDRAHYASDFLSNVAVIAGIVAATRFHLPAIDALVGLCVAAALAFGAWNVARGAADQLMDRELADGDRDRIAAALGADPAVRAVVNLRSRAAGPLWHIESDLALDPALTLGAAGPVLAAAAQRVRVLYPAAELRLHALAAENAGGAD